MPEQSHSPQPPQRPFRVARIVAGAALTLAALANVAVILRLGDLTDARALALAAGIALLGAVAILTFQVLKQGEDALAAHQRDLASALDEAQSAREQAESARDDAEAAEKRFRELVQNASDIIAVFAPDGQIRYLSPPVEGLLGYRPEQATGLNAFQLLHPDERETLIPQFIEMAARPGRHPPLEFRLHHSDGTWRFFEARVNNLIGDPGVRGIVANLSDITDRKQAEVAMRFLAAAGEVLTVSLDEPESLDRLARLLIPEMADWCTIDRVEEDGSGSRAAAVARDPRIAGLLQEMVRRFPLDLEGNNLLARVLRSGEPMMDSRVSDEIRRAGAQSEEHFAIMQAIGTTSRITVPLIAQERRLGAISTGLTGTDRAYGPADLALVQEIARRAALALDNARLYRDLREAVRLRDEFLASISHDLQTPITTIKGTAQLLARRASRVPEPEREPLVEGLTRIDAATTRITGQVAELLDLSRLQAGQQLTLDTEPVDLVALAQRIAADHQRTTQQHDLRLLTELPALTGDWDSVRVERVLANVISNAIKYSPDGGEITITVAREGNAEGGDWARISVRDPGVGIPAADLPRIFERFHRGANVVGQIKGTGIGLAGARRIVELHGGTISAESTEGAGTTITIRLPLTGDSAQGAESGHASL